MTTVRKKLSKHANTSSPRAQRTPSTRRSRKPVVQQTSSHNAITSLATKPHPTATPPLSADTSAGSQFAYPTPKSIPRGNPAIIGLSITIGLLLAFLILGGVLWYLRRRTSSTASVRSDEIKMTRVDSASIREHTIAGPSYEPPVVQQPSRPARPSERVRTWYGKRVPSGWL